MARKSKAGLSDVLFKLAVVLPWWGGVALAGVSYVVLHHYAIAEVPAVTVPGEVGRMAVGQMVKVLASVGQYLVPLVLLAGAVASWQGRRKRQGLVSEVARDASGQALRAMSWRDFELLVGEAFRVRGYSVAETGGGGADGGIDLSLRKGGETFLVQCKQWRAYKVPVNIVRELYGVMAAEGASGGFVVSSGVFTAEAQAFAKGRNIELIDGAALTQMLKQARLAAPLAPLRRAHPRAAHLPSLRQSDGEAPCQAGGQHRQGFLGLLDFSEVPWRLCDRLTASQIIICLIADGLRDMQFVLARRLIGA